MQYRSCCDWIMNLPMRYMIFTRACTGTARELNQHYTRVAYRDTISISNLFHPVLIYTRSRTYSGGETAWWTIAMCSAAHAHPALRRMRPHEGPSNVRKAANRPLHKEQRVLVDRRLQCIVQIRRSRGKAGLQKMNQSYILLPLLLSLPAPSPL